MEYDSLIELKIFLHRSKLRIDVLKKLEFEPQVAIFLAKELKKHRTSISRVFKDLEKKELIKCLNPNDFNFIKYEITDLGKKLLKIIV